MAHLTLLSLFEQSENELKQELANLQLPRDEKKFKSILSDLFVEHIKVSEYKQELTASELSIFQSAIQLVEASMHMNQRMLDFTPFQHRENTCPDEEKTTCKKQIISPLITGAGILVAGALPYWGVVLLAIVASAANAYVTRKNDENICSKKEEATTIELKVNGDAIVQAAREMCQSIDNLMSVNATNIDNLKSRLSTKQEATLANTYRYLLDRLAILYRDKTNKASQTEIDDDIAKVFKTLKNYNYEFVHYSDETKEFYEIEELEELSAPEEVEVAIMEHGKCIAKGKYYQPKK